MNTRRIVWILLAASLVAMLSYGSLAGGEPSAAERALAVAQSLRCPQCAGESVAESNVAAAKEMRADINRRIEEGQSGDEIRAVYAARYGEAILLTPPARGLASLVWIIPVVAGALAAAALTLAFRLRRVKGASPAEADATGVDTPKAPHPEPAPANPKRTTDRAGGTTDRAGEAGGAADRAGETTDRTGETADRTGETADRTAGGTADRAGEADRADAPPRRNPLTLKRSLAILLVVALLAGGGGIVLASALGTRTSSDAATGDIRQSVRGKLFTARELMAAGQFEEADAVYAEVLSEEPTNTEALAWRGWGQFLQGDLPAASETLSQAILSDAGDPAARVFGAVVAARSGRYEEAADHLRVFDSLEAPPEMTSLVNNSNLRADVLDGLSQTLAERLADNEPADSDDWTAFDALASSADTQVLSMAAWRLDFGGRPVAAGRLYQIVLQSNPDNLIALLGRGVQLTSEGFMESEEFFNEGVKALDRLVELAPQDPESRYWRALAAFRQRRLDDARADLDVLDDLEPEPSESLGEAVRDLRERIDEAERSGE